MQKNPVVALLLSCIPGAGHAYLGRPFRFLLYALGFFGPIGLMLLLMVTNSGDEGFIIFLMLIAAASWGINMLDMIITLLSGGPKSNRKVSYEDGYAHSDQIASLEQQREKTQTILMSLIPGIGHMSLGLMQRGIAFLVAFLGLFAIVVFVSIVTHTGVFLIFLIGLPIIWIYSMFDAIQQLNRKHRGELLEDRPLFEEMESYIGTGKKNKVLAATLSLFPGAGHLYLGLQKRGLQIMGGFLIAIYLMDSLRLTIFLFLMPLVWFFAFFDALQQMSRYERNEMNDQAVVAQLAPYQKWIGVGLLVLGVYYLGDRFMATYVSQTWPNFFAEYAKLKYNLPTAVVAFVMIVAGLRLVFGGSKKQSVIPQARDDRRKEGRP